MKYRKEIDGLRALAVLPVIFFHAGVDLFSGGYIGVDVFFVISGYLITSIIIKDIENNNFSILYFLREESKKNSARNNNCTYFYDFIMLFSITFIFT